MHTFYVVYNIVGYRHEHIEGIYAYLPQTEKVVQDFIDKSHTNRPSYQAIDLDLDPEKTQELYVLCHTDRDRSELLLQITSCREVAEEVKDAISSKRSAYRYTILDMYLGERRVYPSIAETTLEPVASEGGACCG
jgi:hypothetical protein